MENCRNCGIEIENDITNPLMLCDECEKEPEEKEHKHIFGTLIHSDSGEKTRWCLCGAIQDSSGGIIT